MWEDTKNGEMPKEAQQTHHNDIFKADARR